jgi:riboflavin transporter FmnP
MKNNKARFVAKVGVLAALASGIMVLETPIPFMPSFLKLDLSELVALLGAFSLGPLAAVFIDLIKNMVHLPFTITGGVGELASFIVGCAFVVPAGLIYKSKKSVKTAIIGLAVGSIAMVITATLMNYLVIIPLYIEIFAGKYNITPDQSLQSIVEMGTKENKGITDLKTLILFGIVPFNIFKVLVISILTFFTYKRVSPILHK